MFIFGVFTGLSYCDIKSLRKEQILTDNKGNQWISIQRKKTNTESIVPLLDIPKEIIRKYEGTGEGGKVFKMLCMNVKTPRFADRAVPAMNGFIYIY